MKKHMYKLVVGMLLCTTMLSATACSTRTTKENAQTNQKIPKGRYIEENITLPQEVNYVMDSHVYEEGKIQLFARTEEGHKLFSTQDGATWEEHTPTWLQTLEDTGMQVQKLGYGKEEIMYVAYLDENYTMQLAKVIEDGTLETIPVNLEQIGMHLTEVLVRENNEIILGGQGRGAVKVDPNTGDILVEYIGSGESVSLVGEQLAMLDGQKGGVVLYDLATGEMVETIPCEGKVWGGKLVSGKDNSLYLMNDNGISRLAPGGSLWENIVDSNMSSFGIPSYYLGDAALLDKETFLALFSDQTDGAQLIKYTYDETMPARPTTEINLYMLYDNMTIRQAVAEYHRQNPDVFINMQVGIQPEDGIAVEDAVRTLNTQLLAGKGPDLMVLDGLPIHSYIEKGVLLDMSDFAGEMLTSSKWLSNILGAYENEDGSIYTLPTKFSLPVMWGNKEILDNITSIEGLSKYAQEHPNQQLFMDMYPQELIRNLYGITAHTWLDEKGYIKEEAFTEFLEGISAIVTTTQVDKWDAGTREYLAQEYLAYNDIELLLHDVADFLFLEMLNSAIIQKGNSDFGLVFGDDTGVFSPKGLIGINATSKHQDLAKEIVELTLSKDVQQVRLAGEGLSVHKEVIENEATLEKDKNMVIMGLRPFERPVERTEVTQEVYTQFYELIKKAHRPAHEDKVLLELILEETKGYFDGEDTAQEAAAKTAQRTKAYLSE